MQSERRKYRSGAFGVNVATSVPPQTFYEIETIMKELRAAKAEVVRQLVLLGLAEYRRNGRLPARAAASECTSLPIQR